MKMLITYTTKLRELTAEFDRQSDLFELLSKLDSGDDYDEHDAKRVVECEDKLDKLRLDIATEAAMCFNAKPIVLRALDNHVTNIGQLDKAQARALKQATKKGILVEGKDYTYPMIKTCWLRNPQFPVIPSNTITI